MRVFKTVLFWIILLFLLGGMSYIIQAELIKNDAAVQSRNKSLYSLLREPENSIDVVIVGDSLSYSSVSPMELWRNHGISAFVCGQSGQTIQEAFHMLEHVFQRQSPKLIILETNVLFKEKRGIAWIKELAEGWISCRFPLIRGHDIWKSVLTGKKYIAEDYKGFAFRCQIYPYKKGNYMKKTKEMHTIPDAVSMYMNCILEICKKEDAELLLLSTPSPKNYNYAKHNAMNQYARDHSLNYLNMNLELDRIGINLESDSLDHGDHLNLNGALKVSGYLGQYITDHFQLQDHRREDSYAFWEKEAEKYEKRKKVCLEQMNQKA